MSAKMPRRLRMRTRAICRQRSRRGRGTRSDAEMSHLDSPASFARPTHAPRCRDVRMCKRGGRGESGSFRLRARPNGRPLNFAARGSRPTPCGNWSRARKGASDCSGTARRGPTYMSTKDAQLHRSAAESYSLLRPTKHDHAWIQALFTLVRDVRRSGAHPECGGLWSSSPEDTEPEDAAPIGEPTAVRTPKPSIGMC